MPFAKIFKIIVDVVVIVLDKMSESKSKKEEKKP
jgi:hypothetical protein